MATKRILVIDDEPAIQEVIQGCLELIGEWRVLIAGSGMQGIQIATTEQPDAILLDVSMPEMDGIETLQKLRSLPVTSNIPVAFLTAISQPIEPAQLSQLKVAGLITKPFMPRELISQITELFNWNAVS